MITLKHFMIACFTVMLFSGAAFADAPNRTINVTGEAEINVVPDQVIISMTAQSRGGVLTTTQKENDRTVAEFLDFVTKKLDVDKKHVQTDFTNVQPAYKQCNYRDEQSGKCSSMEVSYYNVQKGIQVKLNDLETYETLISKALELGITHINNIQFITTELRTHRDKARENAAKASQEKARALANTLGMELGQPITINANDYSIIYPRSGGHNGQTRMMQNSIQSAPNGGGADGGSTLAIGQIKVSAKVHVTYELK